jgi:mono/diheme cytochrome c family protein
MKPLPVPATAIPGPDPRDRVATGRYLATNLGCWSCHSADFAQQDDLHPERSKGFFGGGNQMLDANARPIVTANITLDATGIGSWTEAQFIHAVKRGFRPDKKPLRYPMAAFVELEDDEVAAIYAYLKTVPKLQHAVARTPDAVIAGESGEVLYHKYACQSCHGETGLGLCDLRKGHHKYPSDAALIAFIKNPALTVPGSRMPAWDGVIEEGDYAPLAAYVRRLGREPYRTAGGTN